MSVLEGREGETIGQRSTARAWPPGRLDELTGGPMTENKKRCQHFVFKSQDLLLSVLLFYALSTGVVLNQF